VAEGASARGAGEVLSGPGESGSGLDVRALIKIRDENESLKRQLTAALARVDLLETTIDRIVAAGNSVRKG
jgi:hypothetical protein